MGELAAEKHAAYILKVERKKDDIESVLMEHLRMNGAYWGLTTLDILDKLKAVDQETVISWVMSCQDESGGFGGNEGHDQHLLYTLSAIQILALFHKIETLDVDKVANYVASLQNEDGSLNVLLYTNFQCPFAQRVWITRNYKGLQDKIKLVPIDLANRPAWYKEKVYPENKVPALEHDNKIIGESLDLVRYLDAHFEGPALLPNDSAKKEYAEELIAYVDTFNSTVMTSFKGDAKKEAGVAFDRLESALEKFEGPFLLGEISLVDFVYIPFVERYQTFLQEVFSHDIIPGRPKLATWIDELNKIDAYTQTKADPEYYIPIYKKRIMGL